MWFASSEVVAAVRFLHCLVEWMACIWYTCVLVKLHYCFECRLCRSTTYACIRALCTIMYDICVLRCRKIDKSIINIAISPNRYNHLSVPEQMTAWKNSFLKWPEHYMFSGPLNPAHSLSPRTLHSKTFHL